MTGRTERDLALRHIAALLAPQRRLLVVIALSVAAGALLEVVPPLIVGAVIDGHLAVGNAEGLLQLGLLYLLAGAGLQALGFTSGYLTAIAAQRTLQALRVRLFAHLQALPTRYFDVTPLGDIISRCTADIDTIDVLFSSGIANMIADLTRLATISLTMLALSPLLTLIAGLAVPPLLWFTRYIQRRVLNAERANRAATGWVNVELHETLGGAEAIRAIGRERFFEARFGNALQAMLNAYLASTRYSAVYTPFMVILASVIIAALLWVGTQGALAGLGITVGTLTSFVLLFRRFFTPITTLGEEWQTVQSALSGAERVFQVLALPAEERRAEAQAEAAQQGGALIELKDVRFGYEQGREVLKGVSLQVRAGEHVALVGRTGAGKSTLVHLIGGLYAPWSGDVRVAGADPIGMGEEARRRRIGVVPQMMQLFSGTLLDNLTRGDGSISRAEVERAAAITGAGAFIAALPRGLDAQLGAADDGAALAQLSAGQRQLLALTRALAPGPPALLFDEATAAIDQASDAAFRAALRGDDAAGQRAVLIVAHRLSTAREADRVIVLDDGRIIEEGAPDELARRGGRFAALLELEAAGWDWQSQ